MMEKWKTQAEQSKVPVVVTKKRSYVLLIMILNRCLFLEMGFSNIPSSNIWHAELNSSKISGTSQC